MSLIPMTTRYRCLQWERQSYRPINEIIGVRPPRSGRYWKGVGLAQQVVPGLFPGLLGGRDFAFHELQVRAALQHAGVDEPGWRRSERECRKQRAGDNDMEARCDHQTLSSQPLRRYGLRYLLASSLLEKRMFLASHINLPGTRVAIAPRISHSMYLVVTANSDTPGEPPLQARTQSC